MATRTRGRPRGRKETKRPFVLDAFPAGPPGPERLDLVGARPTDAEWDALVGRLPGWSRLRAVDLRDASIDAGRLAALLAAVPAGCTVGRRVNVDVTVVELGREWHDWEMLWDFVAPVFRRWTTDLVTLADRLGDPAAASAAWRLAWTEGVRDQDALASSLFDAVRTSVLPPLVRAARGAPGLATYLEQSLDGVDDLYSACFEGSMGNGFPSIVAAWVHRVPALSGTLRCWRGDGGDGPAWDREVAAQIVRWHAASLRYGAGSTEDDDGEE